MAYVQPNSIVQLFRGINLDNRYMHTIYFANEAAQNSWFTSKVAYTFQQISYTRYTRDSIKLKCDTTDIMDCSYLRFKNDRNVDKWYYAFINAVEYVNENTALITYEIDVMQTWFIQNGTIRPCFIERQHVTNDTFGINLETEPVGSETYDFTEIDDVTDNDNGTDFNNYNVVYCTTEEPQSNVRDGLVCGATYKSLPFSAAESSTLKNELGLALGGWDKQQQKADIVDMFMFPSNFCNVGHTTNTYHIPHNGKLDNYTPKNKKLHSYPYSSLYITTNDGDVGQYRWEYFEGDVTTGLVDIQFDLNATLVGGGYIEMHPRAYNGIMENFDAKLVMQNFPKCSWNFDAYQAWIAAGGQYKAQYDLGVIQKKGSLAIAQAGLSGVAGIVGNYETALGSQNARRPNPMTPISSAIGASFTAVNTALNIEQKELKYTEARDKIGFEFKDARYEPNILVGQQVPNISVGKKYLGFKFYKLHVRDDEARRIDDFFSVYGYAINKVETPNLSGRQYWNFIKTRNAEIAGNMPASSKSAIGKIFDGGIFFWKNGDNIGNFSISVSDGSVNNPIV